MLGFPRVINEKAARVGAATLESVFANCIGCKAFALLMGAGLVSPQVCAECADISRRLAAASAPSVARR